MMNDTPNNKEPESIVDFNDITKAIENPRYTIFINTSPDSVYGTHLLQNPKDSNFIIEKLISQFEKDNTHAYISFNKPYIVVRDNALGIEWIGNYEMIH